MPPVERGHLLVHHEGEEPGDLELQGVGAEGEEEFRSLETDHLIIKVSICI